MLRLGQGLIPCYVKLWQWSGPVYDEQSQT